VGNEISRALPSGAATVRPNVDARPRPERHGVATSDANASARARSVIADLNAIFGAANGHEQMVVQRRKHLAIGEGALRHLAAMNLHSVSTARAQQDPRLGEMLHYQSAVRDRIEAFRASNLDLYLSDDPQLIHLSEAKLVHALYDRLSKTMPDAALGVGCSESAQCCFSHLLDEGHGVDLELMHLKRDPDRIAMGEREPDHAFVVIGRDANSDPERHETWNEDAVMCDAMKRLVYPKAEIEAKFAELRIFTQGSTRTEVLARAEGGQAQLTSR
jgi:hypothetical protein